MALKEIRRNAWLVESSTFEYFLREVYENTWGEIWLFNNDLLIFKDWNLFGKLYVDLIGKTLKDKIDAVKILLPSTAYKEFIACKKNSPIMRNLIRLKDNPELLSTIYVGDVNTARPEIKHRADLTEKHDNSWIFYTSQGVLSTDSGVVMLRHNVFPFYKKQDTTLAISWRLKDEPVLNGRLKGEAFQECFGNYENFSHIKLKSEDPFEIEFIKNETSKETDRKFAKRAFSPPGTSFMYGDDVDIAVISALPEELISFAEQFKDKTPLKEMPGGHYIEVENDNGEKCRLVSIHIGKMGNSYSAITTCEVMRHWNPKNVILIGIAGGNRHVETLRLGDIVVSSDIHAYEYIKIIGENNDNTEKTKNQANETKRTEERDIRKYPCSLDLIRAAGNLQARMNKEADDEGLDHDTRMLKGKPRVFIDSIASGNKLIADDEFMKELLKVDRKIIATEMEGEGLMVAIRGHNPQPNAIVIKGVSDYADPSTRTGKHRDDSREKACKSSSEFAFRLIKEGLFSKFDRR